MTDYEKNNREEEEQAPSETEGQKAVSSEENDVIELSDIAIGTTQEDEAIIELTEELIDEAMNGISGMRVEASDDHQMIDLSRDESSIPYQTTKPSAAGAGDEAGAAEFMADDSMEEELSRELDDYFGTDEEESLPPRDASEGVFPDDTEPAATEAPVMSGDMEVAVEKTIRHLYADQINRIVEEMVEKSVSAEMDRLKEVIIAALKKQ